MLDHLGRAAPDNALSDQVLEPQDDTPDEAGSPSIKNITIDPAHDKPSDQPNTMDLAETSLLGESPSSPHADEKEAEQVQPSAPTSSALDLYYSSRFGIESNRVS